MAEVALDAVSKVFPGRVCAVDDLSVRIAEGEFLVLVGPSGCGKTTTLRMIAGLETLTSGSIAIDGRRVNDVHPKDRDVAMVFQDYALYPHMTVRQNLAFSLKMRKVSKDEIARRVRETSTMLGIDTLLDRRPRALSGGQQQRVAVGRAMVRSPKCYLFDEPLSNLDAKLRMQMRTELKRLHGQLATTTVYVTHDQEEAMTLGDRLVVMAEGRVQQIGPPLEVYRRPANRFVADFLGSPPMNFLAGRLEAGPAGPSFTADGGFRVPLGAADAACVTGEDGAVVLGLRPEHLRPRGNGAATSTLTLEVQVVEPLGDRMDVYGTLAGGGPMIARVDAAVQCDVGATLELQVDPSELHLFAPGPYGRRL